MVPTPVSALLSCAPAVGFSGSRSVVPPASVWVPVCAAVGAAPVFVGCAAGVDAACRSAFPAARVFRASGFGAGRGAFAARSVAFVRAVSGAGGALLSFPAAACPPGLLPSSSASRCFCGAGSGSWASLAFAIGLGLPCAVWLPAGVPAPAGWGLLPAGGGWFVSSPAPFQLGLL
jgi:hypothetical protein